MDQVARGARLSRALVYVYFKDKQELLFAIGERAMTPAARPFRRRLRRPMTSGLAKDRGNWARIHELCV